jgi:hypothetical protein
MSRRQASEHVALGYDAVWLLRRNSAKSALLPSLYFYPEDGGTIFREAELPKSPYLAVTMKQLYECWVQVIWYLAEKLRLLKGDVLQSDID